MNRCNTRPTSRLTSPEIDVVTILLLYYRYLTDFARHTPDITPDLAKVLKSLTPDIRPTYVLF